MSERQNDNNILDNAWAQVVGGMDWLKSVLIGEFADHRPLSAVVADMLVSFIPGVVIVTSARDAIAVILRLANYPEKRKDLMEWVLLCACLIVIALPIAMAAGGLAAAGVGAIVGGIAGSELGAAIRAVMLMLIKEASKLVELVQFLQKFIKGDILKFLRALKFAPYEKALVSSLKQFAGKLVEIVRSLRTHLESLNYFNALKSTIAQLAAWERKFYAVQQDALTQIPKALAELDARLAKVLAQTAPKEVHTAASGVQAHKPAVPKPVPQRIRDTPGKPLAAAEAAAGAKPKPKPKPQPKPASTPKPGGAPKPPPEKPPAQPPKPSPKDKPDPVAPATEGPNAKKQAVLDAAAAADRERITRLSLEARDAQKAGNADLAKEKINEAREILKPYLPKQPGDSWDEVVKRLDVSSPKDGAVFWSGTAGFADATKLPDAARVFAENIGGVTLETTAGGRIIDNWPDLAPYKWNADYGDPPWSSDLWGAVSEKYANAASGNINLVQTPDKLWDPRTVWHKAEKPTLKYLQDMGQIGDIKIHVVDGSAIPHELSPGYIEELLKFDQRPPKP